MAGPLSDQDETRLALAALFAALARTLGEQDETFPSRYDANLQRIYNKMKHYPSEPLHVLETLRWTHELIELP